VEQARSTLALKRAARWQTGAEPELRLLALDDAILALAAIEPRKSSAIELHYFAGLGPQEMADAMEVSTTTAQGDLRIAEAWVNRQLTQQGR
jgi:DNA-directed RNA polymerase specialized sigma24 family protein